MACPWPISACVSCTSQMLAHRIHLSCRHEEALVDYTQALHMQPNNPEALWHRGKLYAALGRAQAAVQDFSSAIVQDRTAAACFDARCPSLLVSKASQLCEKAAIAYLRQRLYAALDRAQAAVQDFSSAIVQDRTAAACFDARCLTSNSRRHCISQAVGQTSLCQAVFMSHCRANQSSLLPSMPGHLTMMSALNYSQCVTAHHHKDTLLMRRKRGPCVVTVLPPEGSCRAIRGSGYPGTCSLQMPVAVQLSTC